MGEIKKVRAREILDSKGDPTVEAEVVTGKGAFRASSPSGVSTGDYEAVEIRDAGERFGGRGVGEAVENVERVLGPEIEGRSPVEQEKIDEKLIALDGTSSKKNLGANALLPLSIAVLRAGAGEKEIEIFEHLRESFSLKGGGFPRPCFLIIEGGLHAGGSLKVQEFMVVFEAGPVGETLEKGVRFYKKAGERLRDRFGARVLNTGLEGGLTPPFPGSEAALENLSSLLGKEGEIVLDAAGSHFFDPEKGLYTFEGRTLDGEELAGLYREFGENYPVLGIEDPFDEDDFKSWETLNSKVGPHLLLIGDDLTATNRERIRRAEVEGCVDGVVVKPNQAGTVTETVEAARFGQKRGLKIFVKHRSGETNDFFITDLAVALGADFLMAGAPVRGERVAKYNRLLEIGGA